jgi:hypothetical protein
MHRKEALCSSGARALFAKVMQIEAENQTARHPETLAAMSKVTPDNFSNDWMQQRICTARSTSLLTVLVPPSSSPPPDASSSPPPDQAKQEQEPVAGSLP